jgi:hypothetical protein
VRGPATIVEAPEGDSRIVIVDVRAKDADARVAAAWAAYQREVAAAKSRTTCRTRTAWSKHATTPIRHLPTSAAMFGGRRVVRE